MSDETQRKLTTIVAADIAGFSRLVGLDEESTLAAQRAHRTELIEPLLAEHHGRIANTAGDSFLLEFPSAVEAVRCAVAVQQGMDERNTDVPAERRIAFRIGINVGDVVTDGDDLLGDGVNIAARLEGICNPGGIVLSDDAYRQVRDRLEIAWQDGGAHEVKNIARQVQVWRWQAGALPGGEAPPTPANKPSIAVLPFENMSADPEQEYFADGISEDILTALSRFSQEITVIDRHSSFTYKGKSVTAKQVGQELGADYMLEGSVRRSGGRVRITAQLIECATGGHLWAERYDRSLEDIFEVQDEITRHITTALSIELVYGTYAGNWMRGTESFEAWDAMTKGVFEFMKFSRQGLQSCIGEAERALAADPGYGTAFAMKGFGLAVMARYFSGDPEPLWDQARHWCEKALAIEASRPMGLGLLGYCDISAGRFEEAVESLKEAISLAPTAENHYILGQAYLYLGRAKESIAQTEQAMRLSPLYPGYFLFNMIESHRILGQIEDALVWVDKCIGKMPDSPLPLVRKAGLLSLAGRREEAEILGKQYLAVEPDFSVATWAKGQSYRNPEHIEPVAEALRRIGLPD